MISLQSTITNRKRPLNWLQKNLPRYVWVVWLFIFLTLVAGLITGIYGFSISEKLINSNTGNVELPDAVYATLKLLKLGDHTSSPTANGWIMLSRFLLPLCVSLAAIIGLFTALRKCYHRARAYRFRNHTIICGLGDRGVSYIKDAVNGYINRQRDNLHIVVIEKDPENPGVKFCYDEGIPVFIGDATKPSVLALGRPKYAKEVFVLFPDDGKNIAVANTLANLYNSMHVHRRDNIKCYLSVMNPALHSQFTDHDFAFRNNNERRELPIKIEFCYSHEYLAEKAITKGIRNLIVRDVESGKFDKNTTPEIVVIGAGYRGRKIIANIARLFHLTNEVNISGNKAEYCTPVKLTIYDKDANAAKNLYNEYPILQNSSDEHIPLSSNDEIMNLHKNLKGGDIIHNLPLPELVFKTVDFEQPQVIAKEAHDIYSNKNVKSVIIAMGSDSLSVSTALQFERIFDTCSISGKDGHIPQIVVYYEKYGGFDTLFGVGDTNYLQLESLKNKGDKNKEKRKSKVIPLCNWSSVSFDKDMNTDKVDEIAIGVNACYNRHANNTLVDLEQSGLIDLTDDEFNKAKQDFEKLPSIQVSQNRNQVLHNQIKLNLIDYSIIRKDRPLPEGFEYIDNWEEIVAALKKNADWLCRLEHQRWWAEHLLGGGHYAKERDDTVELHPDMVPFEFIHDVSPEIFGDNTATNKWSKAQMIDYNALVDMVISFKHAGYLPIRKIKKSVE